MKKTNASALPAAKPNPIAPAELSKIPLPIFSASEFEDLGEIRDAMEGMVELLDAAGETQVEAGSLHAILRPIYMQLGRLLNNIDQRVADAKLKVQQELGANHEED